MREDALDRNPGIQTRVNELPRYPGDELDYDVVEFHNVRTTLNLHKLSCHEAFADAGGEPALRSALILSPAACCCSLRRPGDPGVPSLSLSASYKARFNPIRWLAGPLESQTLACSCLDYGANVMNTPLCDWAGVEEGCYRQQGGRLFRLGGLSTQEARARSLLFLHARSGRQMSLSRTSSLRVELPFRSSQGRADYNTKIRNRRCTL